MKYELSHDTIAKQVHQKASTEARTRRKVERYIREHYEAWQQRGVALTQDDIDFVWPYLEQVNSPAEEIAFVQAGKRKLLRARRIRRIIWGSITAAFAILALWAFQQRNQAVEREAQSKSMRVSLAARYALYEGKPALAFRLAEHTLEQNNDEAAIEIAREVLTEVQANPLVRDVQHEDSISVLQFSLDGTFFLSASLDGEVRLSDLSGKVLMQYQQDQPVLWASLLDNDQRLAVQMADNTFSIYELATAQSSSFSAAGQIKATSVLRTEPLLAAAINQRIQVWDIAEKEAALVLEQATTAPLTALQIVLQNEGWELLTADQAGNAYRWSQAGERLTTYPNVLSEPITGIAIDGKAEKVIFRTVAGDFLTTYMGDTLQLPTPLVFRAFQPNASAFAGNDTINRVVSLSRDSSLVYIFNFGSKDSDIDMQHSPKTTARCGIMSMNGKRIVSGSADNETVVFYIKDKFTDQNQTLFRFNNRTDWGAFAPNHAHFLSSASGNKALLWKLDQEYVENKKGITLEQMMGYYQSRLRPLNREERAFYQLD